MDDILYGDLVLDSLDQRVKALEARVSALEAGRLLDRALESPKMIARLVERAEEMMGRD